MELMGEKRYGGPLSEGDMKVTRESALPTSWDSVPVCLDLLEGAGGKGWDVMVIVLANSMFMI